MEKIASLSKSKTEVAKLFYKKMISSGSQSKEFLTKSYIDDFQVIYAPFYVVSIDYRAEWAASFGFDRIEHYTHYRKVHSNGSYHMEPETRQKTVTDWSVHSGQASGSISMLAYGGQDQPKIGKLVEGSFSTPKSYTKSFQDGSTVELEFQQYERWRQSNSSRIDSAINSHVVQKNRQGDRQRDWKISYRFEDEFHKIYIPVYSAKLIYKNKSTNILMTSGGSFSTDFNKSFQDDSGFIEDNDTLLFWSILIIFSVMTYFTFWSVLAGGVAYFIHKYVIGEARSDARIQYEQILESRLEGAGFIGAESSGQNIDIVPDSIWRTSGGLRAYLGAMLGLVIFVGMMAADWRIGGDKIQAGASNNPKIATAADASPTSASSVTQQKPASDFYAADTNSTVGQPQEVNVAGVSAEAVASAGVPSPSFNCAVGTTPSEKLICSSSDLAALDVEMARLYKGAIRKADSADAQIGKGSELNRAALIGNQSIWISGNNKCRENECLMQRYSDRIDFLKAYSPN